jgi:hypothetical protein
MASTFITPNLFCRAIARGFFAILYYSLAGSIGSLSTCHIFFGAHRSVLDQHLVHVKRARVWCGQR